MANYRLNLNQQSNGDYEVHKDDCRYYPSQNYDNLDAYNVCSLAVTEVKKQHIIQVRLVEEQQKKVAALIFIKTTFLAEV